MNIIYLAANTSSRVGVFKSFYYDACLKGASLLNTAVQKLPPSMKKCLSFFTVLNRSPMPKLLEFNEWLKQKSMAHDLMQRNIIKELSLGYHKLNRKNWSCLKTFAANAQTKGTIKLNQHWEIEYPHAAFCVRVIIAFVFFWYSKKTLPLSKPKMVARTKLSFSPIKDKFIFRQCFKSQNTGTMVATALKTHLYKERKAFSTQTPQRMVTATQSVHFKFNHQLAVIKRDH